MKVLAFSVLEKEVEVVLDYVELWLVQKTKPLLFSQNL